MPWRHFAPYEEEREKDSKLMHRRLTGLALTGADPHAESIALGVPRRARRGPVQRRVRRSPLADLPLGRSMFAVSADQSARERASFMRMVEPATDHYQHDKSGLGGIDTP